MLIPCVVCNRCDVVAVDSENLAGLHFVTVRCRASYDENTAVVKHGRSVKCARPCERYEEGSESVPQTVINLDGAAVVAADKHNAAIRKACGGVAGTCIVHIRTAGESARHRIEDLR